MQLVRFTQYVSPRIMWLVAVVLFCIPVQGEDGPSNISLLKGWKDWSDSLKNLPAVRIQYTATSASKLKKFGIVSEQVTAHRFFEGGYQCTETQQETEEGKTTQTVALCTPQDFIVLEGRGQGDWRIKDKKGKPLSLNSYFSRITTISRAILDGIESNQVPGSPRRVEHQNGNVSLHLTFSQPIEFLFDGYIPTQVSKITLEFAKEFDYAPVRVERYLVREKGDMWSCASIGDFTTVGAVLFPTNFRKYHSSTEDLSEPKETSTFTVAEISEVSQDEVIKRCSLTYWGLNDLSGGSSRFKWLAIVNVLILAAGFAYYSHRANRSKLTSED